MMRYKGYIGVVRVDTEEDVLRGRVVNTRDVITFQGRTPKEALEEFKHSVDEYLGFCKARGEEPEKPFSGNFPVRTRPALHRKLAVRAELRGQSLNRYVISLLEQGVRKDDASRLPAKEEPAQQPGPRKRSKSSRPQERPEAKTPAG